MADRIDNINDDNVQHGIDDNPHDDGKKGLELGALGGGAVGAMAGLAAGPIGAIVGAIVGGTAGSIASGAAVDAVDSVDNDDTITGVGGDSTRDYDRDYDVESRGAMSSDLPGNDALGVQTGGVTTAGADTRGIMEKTADAVTGDRIDDKTGGRVLGDDSLMGTTGSAASSTLNDGVAKVELAAEELHVDKVRQQMGEVEIHKEVVQEQVQVPVTLEHEEVVITRRAVDGGAAGTIGDAEEVMRIPVSEEVANVTKTARVVEEVEVGTRTVTENQTVTGTVRHEEVDIDDSTKNRM